MIAFIRERGWREEEPDEWRRDDPKGYGYIVLPLEVAYALELANSVL